MRADLSGRAAPPPRWFLAAVGLAALAGVLVGLWLWAALSGPAPSPSPAPTATPSPTAGGQLDTPGPCPTALITGTLVYSELSGVALETELGAVQVVWPAGYGVRQEGHQWVLLDERGRELARIGQVVDVGGGFVGNAGRLWDGCGGVTVLPLP